MAESREKNAAVGEVKDSALRAIRHAGSQRRRAPRSVVRLQIPAPAVSVTALDVVEADVARAVAAADRAATRPRPPESSAGAAPDFTVEDLTAFAAQIGELVDHARYRVVARAMEMDLARAEAASRRIPPPRLRLAK